MRDASCATDSRTRLISMLLVSAALASSPALAADSTQAAADYGISAGIFASRFVGGESGPETPLSATNYDDTFKSGAGLRLELYRDFPTGWRGQVGLVHTRWSGKFFVGGEFPAGAQFGDFSLTGVYVGGRVPFGAGEGFRPYILGNLGLAYLSDLTVVSAGSTIPYWSGTWRDYLEIGGGVARKLGTGSLTLDLRLQAFGKPKSENFPIAEATGGQTLVLGIGYEWGLRR